MNDSTKFNFDSLRLKLDQEGGFPKVFMFKFIVPSNNRDIALVQNLFSEDSQISIRASKSGKYTSISAKEVMIDSDSIIKRYQKALEIDGLIAL
jgi:exonuclease III